MTTRIGSGPRLYARGELQKFATPGDVHVDALLTDFAINFRNLPFVGEALFPIITVRKESDKFAVFNKDRRAERVPNALRAPRSRANTVDWSHEFDDYHAKEYSLAAGVDDRERDNADAPIDPDQRAARAALIGVELAREDRIAKLATTSGNFSTTHTKALTGTAQWSDATVSDPLGDFLEASEVIEQDAGVTPNTMILPTLIRNKLRVHDAILEAFKYTRGGVITDEMIASYFGVANLVIAGAVKNTAAEGAAASLSRIWGKNVVIAFVDPATSTLDGITFGKTFRCLQSGQPRLVYTWRDEGARTDYKELSEKDDEKITAKDCGYLLRTVIA